MTDDELYDYEQRMKLAKGIQIAFSRVHGTGKLDRCARLGISNYAIDKWVAGASAPTDQNLARLARLSGMDQETIRNAGVEYSED